jgi:hypothetical protein
MSDSIKKNGMIHVTTEEDPPKEPKPSEDGEEQDS